MGFCLCWDHGLKYLPGKIKRFLNFKFRRSSWRAIQNGQISSIARDGKMN